MHDVLHRLLTALCLLAAGVHPAAAADDAALLAAVADHHVIPAYQRLDASTATLGQAVRQHCADQRALAPDAALRAAYAEAFLAWQGIQHLRFGPIQVLSRDFRMQLWPDKRGSIAKHLRRLLAQREPARLQPDAFADGSAAVQGFGALERLLYDTPSGDAQWRCEVAAAMAANLHRMAAATLQEWQDGPQAHRLMFATAYEGNDYYDGADELNAKLLNNINTQLERLIEQKLSRPMGDSVEAAMPKRAEAWRSGLSLAAIRYNVVALQSLYTTGFAARVDDAALATAIKDRFDRALAELDAVEQPLVDAVHDADARMHLHRLRDQLTALRTLVAKDLTTALALPLGFNSLDGD